MPKKQPEEKTVIEQAVEKSTQDIPKKADKKTPEQLQSRRSDGIWVLTENGREVSYNHRRFQGIKET